MLTSEWQDRLLCFLIEHFYLCSMNFMYYCRLVKTAPSGDGEIDCDQPIMVSQLALVDLAGSERCKRTGNTDKALKEAGKINNSLMNLRRCMERLRDNQKTGRNGAVPYRDDRLTHLFRNYFEGIGSVKMIVCVNPRQVRDSPVITD